jgi:protein TonB
MPSPERKDPAPPARAAAPGGRSLVDEVFARTDPAARLRWVAAALTACAAYALTFGVLPLVAGPSLEEWASSLAARVHGELGREREIVLEQAPPPPPPVPAAEPPPPASPRVARAPVTIPAVRSKVAAPPAPASAASAPLVARAPSAEPLDMTATTFVTGSANAYAGGATTSAGTSTQPVAGRTVDPHGNTAGLVGVPGGSLARPVGLDEADWSCPWPREADAAEIDEQVVIIKAAVRGDGTVESVKVLADPGFGFGQAARACALRTHFQPARDEAG